MDFTALASCLAQTLSPMPAPRKAAESSLAAMSTQPGHALAVLALLSDNASTIDPMVRQSAAVHFKNVVKYNWVDDEDEYGADNTTNNNSVVGKSSSSSKLVENGKHDGTSTTSTSGRFIIPDGDKDQIRGAIVTLMLSTPPLVQAQLSEALTIISLHDFPRRWQSLLPELTAYYVRFDDYSTICNSLMATNAVLKRLRDMVETEELRQDLRYIIDTLVQPLLALFKATGKLVGEKSSDVAVLRHLFKAIYYICRIFYSLHQQVIPDLIEDHIKEWMEDFHLYLNYDNPGLIAAERQESTDAEKPTVVDDVKAAICENLNIYTMKYEEEFEPFVKLFVTDVWSLLVKVDNTASQDQLAAQAIRFLTTVARGVHHSLFNDQGTLKSIVENIVLPNLRIREEDEELFEMNYTEYIRRDIEGSDSDTRRRMACELVKALVVKFQGPITEMCSSYVSILLQQYSASPSSEWKLKDCAIFLVMALTVRGKVASKGATSLNELVNIPDFYRAHIVTELQSPVNVQPVLKADALKFVTTFRMHIPKTSIIEILPFIVGLLGSESNVVHSYAAHCLERILLIREDDRSRRFTNHDILPFAQDILKGLFGAFQMPDSGENEYVMKCIMRVLNTLGNSGAPVLSVCLAEISKMLVAVCENPRNPTFNHYLFESVAAIVRIGLNNSSSSSSGSNDGSDRSLFNQLEMSLLGVVDYVISKEVVEFTPYAFQILAQLVEASPAPLDQQKYLNNFGNWLSPFFWENAGNVPALVRLLKAYLRKAPEEIVSAGKLEGVLGVFQKLIASKAHDHEGFYILNSIVECMRLESFKPYLATIWSLLFRRMQSARTPKFTRCLCIFLCLFICVHGVHVVAEGIESIQAGLFSMLIGTLFEAKNLNSIGDRLERKMVIVSISRVLCECQFITPETQGGLWAVVLKDLIGYISNDGNSDDQNDDEEDNEEPVLYQAAFALLANTSAHETDPVSTVQNPKQFVAQSLAAYSSRRPGVLLPLLQQLPPNSQETLRHECSVAGVIIG